MLAAGVLAVVVLAVPAPPDPHALLLRRTDVPAGWSIDKRAGQELGGCRRVPYVSRAYSPGFSKVTADNTKAAASRATVYASARAQEAIRLSRDPVERKCALRSFQRAAKGAFGPTTRVTSLVVKRPRHAVSVVGYSVTYRTQGILVNGSYEYVYMLRGRVVSELLMFGVFRRIGDALIGRLTDVLAGRLARMSSSS